MSPCEARTIEDAEIRRVGEVVVGVGKLLRESSPSRVEEKAPHDLVTDLDVLAERRIRDFLASEYPDDILLSEESSSSVPYAQGLWVLDPLDGTTNRATGLPFYAVSLALFVRGVPALAYVYDPERDELFWAAAGRGAYLREQRLGQSNLPARTLAVTSATLAGFLGGSIAGRAVQPQKFRELHPKLRNLGSQALHLAYVAAGRLWASIAVETRLWDSAAGALLVREAGAVFTDLSGADPFPLRPGSAALGGAPMPCVAAGPAVHPALIEALGG